VTRFAVLLRGVNVGGRNRLPMADLRAALAADDLDDIVRVNPFTDEPDPTRVHAIVLPHAPTAEMISAVDECQEEAASLGSRDRVTLAGRVAYLHTPVGFGSSDLARRSTSGRSTPLADGTARNWATVTALAGLLT